MVSRVVDVKMREWVVLTCAAVATDSATELMLDCCSGVKEVTLLVAMAVADAKADEYAALADARADEAMAAASLDVV